VGEKREKPTFPSLLGKVGGGKVCKDRNRSQPGFNDQKRGGEKKKNHREGGSIEGNLPNLRLHLGKQMGESFLLSQSGEEGKNELIEQEAA